MMEALKLKETTETFFDQFFEEKGVKNDIFVIEVNEKFFFIESDTVIDMIKKFSPKQQTIIERHLRIYDLLNRNINDFLKKIATDYVKKNYGRN